MDKYYISELIHKSISGELKGKEKEDFENWLCQSNNLTFYESITDPRTIQQKFDIYNSVNSSQSFAQIRERIEVEPDKPSKSVYWSYIKYAAVFILAAGLGWFTYQVGYPDEAVTQEVALEKSNPKGRKTTIHLPDGTIVNLNSESRFKYIDDVKNHRRILQLEGEAFFEVAEDKEKPFTVVTGDISTTALGTSFNVRAYPEESEYRIVLLTGKVEIASNNPEELKKIYLAPGFGVTYDKKATELIKYNFDEKFELGWKNSTLYFDEANIDQVVKDLERWYGVNIKIENKNKVGQWKYSSKFENESLENVLKGISYIQEFKFEIKEKEVTLEF